MRGNETRYNLPLMLGPFSAILFDLDGTLVDSYEPIAESLNRVRAHFDLPPKSLDEVRREVGRGLEHLIADNVGPDRVDEGVGVFRSHYRQVFLARTRLMPGVARTLAALAARGVPMAITSNKPAYFTREIVEGLGLGGLFLAVLGPEMVDRPKPDPEMVLKAIEILGRSIGEVLYVGDMRLDIETCRRAGLAVCVIPGGSDSREELQSAGPDFLLDRFEDLPALIGS